MMALKRIDGPSVDIITAGRKQGDRSGWCSRPAHLVRHEVGDQRQMTLVHADAVDAEDARDLRQQRGPRRLHAQRLQHRTHVVRRNAVHVDEVLHKRVEDQTEAWHDRTSDCSTASTSLCCDAIYVNQILQICTGFEYFETASQDQRLKHRAHIVCRDAVHNHWVLRVRERSWRHGEAR